MFIILYIVRRSRDFIAVFTLFFFGHIIRYTKSFTRLCDVTSKQYTVHLQSESQFIYMNKISVYWLCLYVYISLHMKVNTITIICFPLLRKKEENGRPEKPVYKCFSFTRFYLFIVFYCQIKKKWFNWRCTRYTVIWDTFGNDHRDYM